MRESWSGWAPLRPWENYITHQSPGKHARHEVEAVSWQKGDSLCPQAVVTRKPVWVLSHPQDGRRWGFSVFWAFCDLESS